MPGLDADLPHTRAVERRVVERQRLLEVRVAVLQLTEVEERRAERPLADHAQVRIAQALEQLQHLDRDAVRGADLAGDDVVGGHADQHRNHQRRVVDLPAQLAGALVGGADFRHGIAAAGLDGKAVGHEQRQLGGGPAGAGGLGLQERQAALREARRLVVRVEPCRRLRRAVPVLRRPDVIARDFEQQGDVGETVARLVAVALRQPLGNRPAQRRPARGAQRVEAGVLIHVVREAIAQRQRPVRQFHLADEPHERVVALEPLEPRLDVLVVELERRRP